MTDLSAPAPAPFLAGDTVVVPPVPGAISDAEYSALAGKTTWDLDELDQMHHYAGIGDWWFASERRRELAATIGRRQDRYDALSYECGRRCAIGAAKARMALLDGATVPKPRPLTYAELWSSVARLDDFTDLRLGGLRLRIVEPAS